MPLFSEEEKKKYLRFCFPTGNHPASEPMIKYRSAGLLPFKLSCLSNQNLIKNYKACHSYLRYRSV